MSVTLDLNRIITDFSGLAAEGTSRRAKLLVMRHKFERINEPLTLNAMEKWFENDGIPSKRLVHLARIARAEKRRFDLVSYLIPTW